MIGDLNTRAKVRRNGCAFVLISVVSGLFRCAGTELSPIQAKTPAESAIVQEFQSWRPIDLATNLQVGTNRIVSGDFLVSLLTAGENQINHRGLRLQHAVIEGFLNLANLDIHAEVCFEECRFKNKVDISDAHFFHDLSFQGSVFEREFVANAVHVDGSLFLNVVDAGTNAAVFHEAAHLNGAVIAGKLEAERAEFDNVMDCGGLNVTGDILIPNACFASLGEFGHAQAGHDFVVQGSVFEEATNANFDANGLNVGGTLNIEGAVFAGQACFKQVSVGNALNAKGARFEKKGSMDDFSGLKVGGCADLSGVVFAGPADFILAHISGDLNCEGTVFEDTNSFDELRQITANVSTFNADFGSMQVNGFAMFEKTRFGRSVSFRNARFENLILDAIQWPSTNYHNYPYAANLLRIESVDFQTIRDISSSDVFEHSRVQLEESATNLLALFQRLAPYSFDVYSKLEDYFRREGAPDLADKVFIAAKIREGQGASGCWAKLINWLLHVTVAYGRSPWRAFWESFGVVFIWTLFCWRVMKEKKVDKQRPRWYIAALYSLGQFLPLVDLNAGDLLRCEEDQQWFRCVLGVEKLLGYVLVPLWTIALAGLIK